MGVIVMKTSQKIKLSLVLGIVFSLILNIVGFAAECDDIRKKVLRLHVVAASNSQDDQSLKYKVRDAVLKAGSDIFDGSVNVKNAVEKITPQMDYLKQVAEKTVKENGFAYNVSVELTNEFFPTRTYEKATLPAGKYLALKVVIHKGEGQNWWCVMFPSLCLPVALSRTGLDDVLDEKGVRIVERNPKYEPRFKIIEWIERVKESID